MQRIHIYRLLYTFKETPERIGSIYSLWWRFFIIAPWICFVPISRPTMTTRVCSTEFYWRFGNTIIINYTSYPSPSLNLSRNISTWIYSSPFIDSRRNRNKFRLIIWNTSWTSTSVIKDMIIIYRVDMHNRGGLFWIATEGIISSCHSTNSIDNISSITSKTIRHHGTIGHPHNKDFTDSIFGFDLSDKCPNKCYIIRLISDRSTTTGTCIPCCESSTL